MPAKQTTADERQRHGWIPATVGCYWTRGPYRAGTTQTGDGKRSGYVLLCGQEELGEFLSWAEVERLADRRKGGVVR